MRVGSNLHLPLQINLQYVQWVALSILSHRSGAHRSWDVSHKGRMIPETNVRGRYIRGRIVKWRFSRWTQPL
jgi:hypothetical protein